MGFAISATIAAILLAVGILSFLSARVRALTRMLPIFQWQIWAIVLIGLGVVSGGIGVYQGFFTTATAVGGGDAGDTTLEQEIALSHCVYSAGAGLAGNITVRQDTSENNVVYLDVDTDQWSYSGKGNSLGGANDIDINFTCYREGSTAEDGAVEIVVGGEEFRSEISTSDTNTYNLLETSTRNSMVWDNNYQQTIYVDDGSNDATSSDPKERNYLAFSEGDKSKTLALMGEIDESNFDRLNNYTTKKVTVYQRVGGQDEVIGEIIVNKLP